MTARADQIVAPRFQSPPPTGYDPRGFAVGVLAQQGLAQQGILLQQWRWRYGPEMRERPFPQHRQLAGRFMTLDGTLDQWYPGDHKGCLCSVEPVYARAGRVISRAEAEAAAQPTRSAPRSFADGDEANRWLDDLAADYDLGEVLPAGGASGYPQQLQNRLQFYLGSAYDKINAGLRSGELRPALQNVVDDLDELLTQSVRMPEPVTAYRGVSSEAADLVSAFDEGRLAGATLRDAGFMSTTLNPAVARNFVDDGGMFFELRVPEGTRAILGTDYESELLLGRGSSMRVVSTELRDVEGYDTPQRWVVVELEGA